MNSKQEDDLKGIIASESEVTFGKHLANQVTDWIKNNLDPDDVFDDRKLREYVQKSSLPDDVFTEKELAEWAESNGYVKE